MNSPEVDSDHLFLFIGLRHSGKTTAIRNIFREHGRKPQGRPGDHGAEITRETTEGGSGRILEFGYHSIPNVEQNRLTSRSVLHKLNQTMPTIIFITARLNDSRFVGESSEFTNVLKEVYNLNNVHRLTDELCSNVILLLTHADRPDIKQSIENRVIEYKRTFQKVFHVIPTCVVVGNENVATTEIEAQIMSSTKFPKCNGFHVKLLAFLKSNRDKGTKRQSVGFGSRIIAFEKFTIPTLLILLVLVMYLCLDIDLRNYIDIEEYFHYKHLFKRDCQDESEVFEVVSFCNSSVQCCSLREQECS